MTARRAQTRDGTAPKPYGPIQELSTGEDAVLGQVVNTQGRLESACVGLRGSAV